MKNSNNINLIIKRLKIKYKKEIHTILQHNSAWQLLVATMLSAQSKDTQVNKVTETLFKKYPNIEDYKNLNAMALYKYINTLGLYKNKARNIINASKYIIKNNKGVVPDSIDKLIKIKGIGRKTANVVLSNYFKKYEGIAIDTHCITVSNRLFLIKTSNSKKIEEILMCIIPKRDWGIITNLFIALGKDVCTAKKKYCERCVLNDLCPSNTTFKYNKNKLMNKVVK
ncbi:MAG: endonuclease III [Candidatus Marsarchaeota archaeon]|nr:endonuclease III [Candidatus Marsarchaeota archaeon]